MISGSLYLNSDAISTVTGIEHNFSIKFLPTRPACIAVPQATIYIWFIDSKKLFEYSKSLKSQISPNFNLEPIVFFIVSGCSKISFNI